MTVCLRKVYRDLVHDRRRSVMVVLSLAVGIFALGLTLRTQAVISDTIEDAYATVEPADLTITLDSADPTTLAAVRRVPGVSSASLQSVFEARLRLGGSWQPVIITATSAGQPRVNRVEPVPGSPTPRTAGLRLERSYAAQTGLLPGDLVELGSPGSSTVWLPFTGYDHDLSVLSAHLGSPYVFGYLDQRTAEEHELGPGPNTLQVVLTHAAAEQPERTSSAVRDAVEGQGRTVLGTSVHQHLRPDSYDIVVALLGALRILGLCSLGLCSVLVLHTVGGLMSRQRGQMGVLKVLGATRGTVVLMYLSGVLVLGVLSTVLASAASALALRPVCRLLGRYFNYDITDYSTPAHVWAVIIAAGLGAPLLAASHPVLSATRTSVRQAISPSSGSFGAHRLDRLLTRLRGLPTSQLYAVRNMVRHRGRLVLTLLVLGTSGAVGVAVVAARSSLDVAVDQASDYWRQDVTVLFYAPEPTGTTARRIREIPGVQRVENQPILVGARLRDDGTESDHPTAVVGVQASSPLVRPTLVEGRWLSPSDTDAVVVSTALRHWEPDVRPGQRIRLRLDGRTTSWLVVGVTTPQLKNYHDNSPFQGTAYVPQQTLSSRVGQDGLTNCLLVVTDDHSASAQSDVANRVGAVLEAGRGIDVVTQTREQQLDLLHAMVAVIVVMLTLMAVVFIAVAGLSLLATTDLNLLDRVKEIGVLRAVGASSRQVAVIIVVEAIYVGVLSSLLAVGGALPLSRALGSFIGWRLTSWPLPHAFPAWAGSSWLGLAAVLAAAVAYFPARRAARRNIRETIAHE